MRKYRCNRILEDRKISRRLCAPFFFPPFAREQPRPAQGRLTARSFLLFLHAPPKIFIFEDFDRASLEFQTFSRTYFRSLQKRIDPPSPSPRYSNPFPKLFLELEDALCPSRFQSWGAQSLHSAHHRPYCIGVRASAYINKQARVCIGEFLAAPSIVLSERAGERAREPHREALAGRLLLLLLLLFR